MANIIFAKSSSAQRALAEYSSKKIIDKISTISILVDSFSHNVAAHSLSAISTFFEKRRELLLNPFIKFDHKSWKQEFNLLDEPLVKRCLDKKRELNLKDIICLSEEIRRNLFGLIGKDARNESLQGHHLPIPIDDAITKFLNYLSDKSEFWSGAITGETAGGTIISLYDLIYEFIDNPLFIGTIIWSERITKINFIINNKEFVSVDFSIVNSGDLSGNYEFVKPLNKYDEIKLLLQKVQIFIPGDNVGKHSFYTILENILRNIKHYKYEDITEANLNIDFNEIDNKTCKLTVYLAHDLISNEALSDIVKETNEGFIRGIIDPKTDEPIMGGNSQSFLCARHLSTEIFLSDYEKRDSHIKVEEVNGKYLGYTFNMWIGKEFAIIQNNDTDKQDNYSRFKFLITQEKLGPLRGTSRSLKISDVSSNEINMNNIYQKWLSKFINQYQGISIVDERDCFGNGMKRIHFSHPSADKIKNGHLYVREHGIWRQILKSDYLKYENDIAEALLCGVVIYDNRISNIWNHPNVSPNREDIERELKLFVRSEQESELNIEDNIFKLSNNSAEIKISNKINFLIIHLSFVQKIFEDKYKNDGFEQFINDIFKAVNGRENFRLVITTGRGRSDWKKIAKKSNYSHLIAHKSPNST